MAPFGFIFFLLYHLLIFKEASELRGFLLKMKVLKLFKQKNFMIINSIFAIQILLLFFGNLILRKVSFLNSRFFLTIFYALIILSFEIILIKLIFKVKAMPKRKVKEKEKENKGFQIYNARILEDDWSEEENEIEDTFEDIAGLEEAKENLLLMQDYLFNPESYLERNLEIPKGTLLTGPPGNAKTKLARAYAGRCGTPFLYISASQFVEMFVGVGASRVRDLFKETEEFEKSVVYIDEIDAVGKKRSGQANGGNDEREQALNQLLTELDGFKKRSNIIVLASTNRAKLLDPALTRPGRFTETIEVPNPDYQIRKEILNLFIKKTKLKYEVDLESLAHLTEGFSGAELENLIKKANLIAKKDNERKVLIKKDFIYAFKEVVAGKNKKMKDCSTD
jgi:ATP-dependent metalloprotease FtsH